MTSFQPTTDIMNSIKSILIAAIVLLSAIPAIAGTAVPFLAETQPAATTGSGWELRITPYAWLTAIDGSTGPEGFAADIDSGFDDVFDVLEMAAALQVEARRGRWGFMADAFYAELAISGTLPGPLETDIDLDFKQFLGEFVVFYRVSEAPQSFVDLYAGIRYNSLSLDLEATTNGPVLQRGDQRSADKDWTDPIIGVRTQWEINDRWFLAAKGDIGGFGVESDFTWNLQGSVGYKFNECVSLEVGYRYFDTDYSDGGYIYDIAQSGALIGLNFRF